MLLCRVSSLLFFSYSVVFILCSDHHVISARLQHCLVSCSYTSRLQYHCRQYLASARVAHVRHVGILSRSSHSALLAACKTRSHVSTNTNFRFSRTSLAPYSSQYSTKCTVATKSTVFWNVPPYGSC